MTYRTCLWYTAALLFISVNGSNAVYAQEQVPPFIAESTGHKVNVRAGQSANFERICQLNKGDEVLVLGKEFSWYKIQLPPQAKIYVSKDYVQYLGANAGGIAAADVNVRAGKGVHSTVIGRLTKGEQIYIQEDLDEWYRIEPIAETFGWVSEQFLAFKSKDISTYPVPPERTFFDAPIVQSDPVTYEPVDVKPVEPIPEEAPITEAKRPEMEVFIDSKKVMITPDASKKKAKSEVAHQKSAKPKQVEASSVYKGKGLASFVGYVEKHEDARSDGVHFKIIKGGKPVCYIQGVNHMLDRFIHQQVSVEGTVNQKLLPQYPHPVIVVMKVRLML